MPTQQTTRDHILNFLFRRQTTTTAEISRSLHLTRANIRHHLKILLREGVVVVRAARSTGSKGRPELLFGLTSQAVKHNFHMLSAVLLSLLLQDRNIEEKNDPLQAMVEKFLSIQEWQAHPRKNFSVLLFNCARIMNSMNYEFRWEAHALAPHVILGHCPYAAIIDQHPELCIFDAKLLGTMLGTTVRQVTILEPASAGIQQCVFQVEFITP